ncbi:hypothetical protein SAMN04489752_2412 [Brevibacterium siliguriense]|uniref:Uncharacterized protein n=1 Tax=Brevibacterium siliguriense TaxID=1136497 RepID=A0A1H1UR16_9MICO|nr:hypothetical protein [Brevibacterium siliguriense]SDS74711.1 hypothetical protein SAMN04489752_2412 [Brevibacterium siliguriense]
MRFRDLLIVGLLFTVMSSALIGAQVYDTRQSEITREGNHLLSQHKVAFSGTAEEARSHLDGSLGAYAIYRDLDDTGLVRAVEAARPDKLDLPIHKGRGLRESDHNVAVVGSQVPVESNGTRSFYRYDGEDYEVVGWLGRAEHSLVENDVLIVDRDLVEASTGAKELIIDGPAIKEQATALPPDRVKRADASVNRRASVDLVSPTIRFVVHAVVIVCALFTGILAWALTRRRHRVGFLLGRNPIRQALASLTLFALVGSGVAIVCLLAGQKWFAELHDGFGPTAFLMVAAAVATLCISLILDLARVKSWK